MKFGCYGNFEPFVTKFLLESDINAYKSAADIQSAVVTLYVHLT
jgi:hypothetical protein